MDKSLKPDKKYVTKSILASFINSAVSFSFLAGFIHGIVLLEKNETHIIPTVWLIAAGATILIWLISLPFIILWIKNLEFVIREERVTLYKGILKKIQKNIPLRAVTDFVLERSLLDRMFGIGTIKIQTAGQSPTSSGYEGKMVGLLDYQSLHEDFRHRIGKLHPVSGAVTTEEPLQGSNDAILKQILAELKEIKKNTAVSNN